MDALILSARIDPDGTAPLHPSPLRGGTEGGGPCVDNCTIPHPNPPPQGGREQIEFAPR